MTYTFRKAVRENTSVLVALAGHTGTGKTRSALRLAEGLAGPSGRIVMLDTEAGRGTQYAKQHNYDYSEIAAPFSPEKYTEAIKAADEAGYDVIIIDSMSHEWSGDGGCSDMQMETLHRMSRGDPSRMEALSGPAWRDAKIAHKRMMARLLQTRASVIFCLRAEPKVRFTKRDGRTVIEDAGFQPICEKTFMFEMLVSFMINDQHLPVPIKLGDDFKGIFPLDKPITEESGRLLAEWARGGSQPSPAAVNTSVAPAQQPVGGPASEAVLKAFRDKLAELGIAEEKALSFAEWDALEGHSRDELTALLQGLKATIPAKQMEAFA